MVLSKADNEKIIDELISFSDYLFGKSPYIIFELADFSKTVSRNRQGYRHHASTIGTARSKLVNFKIILITPSRVEMLKNIKDWAKDRKNQSPPIDRKSRKDLIMSYMDEFVQNYHVVESLGNEKDGGFSLGYRPTKERKEGTVKFQLDFIQPSREEIELTVDSWITYIDRK